MSCFLNQKLQMMKHLGRCGRHRHRQVKVEKQSLGKNFVGKF